jgi:hypothetical protein
MQVRSRKQTEGEGYNSICKSVPFGVQDVHSCVRRALCVFQVIAVMAMVMAVVRFNVECRFYGTLQMAKDGM